ncbi:MAG: hypothetical protein U9O94_05500 [Nanoarchaeota archaeon]|nr:hypothetical protein [Nanoarchaeota archaeon]
MDKKKIKKALIDMERSILFFYGEMKWILNSKRGKRFQYMMLGKTFDITIKSSSQIRRNCLGDEGLPKSPLDD